VWVQPGVVARYQKRLSGPLLDRIDVHVEVPRVAYDKLAGETRGEPSAAIRARGRAARARQAQRLAGTGLLCNAEMGPKEVRASCAVAEEAQGLLKAAMARLQLSARAYHRMLKLARTIADLAASERIGAPHLAEALQYRPAPTRHKSRQPSFCSPCVASCRRCGRGPARPARHGCHPR
jgi:magnesium chelatase family protein